MRPYEPRTKQTLPLSRHDDLLVTGGSTDETEGVTPLSGQRLDYMALISFLLHLARTIAWRRHARRAAPRAHYPVRSGGTVCDRRTVLSHTRQYLRVGGTRAPGTPPPESIAQVVDRVLGPIPPGAPVVETGKPEDLRRRRDAIRSQMGSQARVLAFCSKGKRLLAARRRDGGAASRAIAVPCRVR